MKHIEIIKKWFSSIKCNQKILFVLCLTALALPNIFLFFTEQVSLIAKLCNVILPISIYWFLMTLSKRPGKAFLWMFLLIFFAAFQIVLLYLFGNSVIAVDMFLNLVTTNTNEAVELLSNIYVSVIFVIAAYIPLIFYSVCSLYKKNLPDSFLLKQRRYAKYGILAGVILLICSYVLDKDFKIENDIYPVNVAYNAGLATDREIKTRNYYESSQDFRFNAKSTHQNDKEIYVLVIGETARTKNFGIYGYERNTTPLLAGMGDDLLIFKNAKTQSNTTYKSVPMIMSSISAYNYDDIYKQKSIISAFNEVGYCTAFFSNQRRNNSFIEFFGKEAFHYKYIREVSGKIENKYDEELLKYVGKLLSENQDRNIFIVLHTYGSHFNYCERYPADKAYYKPDKVTSASADNKETLINAYDNSIRATDEFLYNLIGMINSQNATSAVLYVSDHGEDIYDDERNLLLHSSPIPTLNQLQVPLFIWTSEEYKNQYPEKLNTLKRNTNHEIATNLAVFHTILDMAGITTFYKKNYYALSHEDFEPCEEPLYLDDHNQPVPITNIR